MAKHPVPKRKKAKSKQMTRHKVFMAKAQKKLFGVVAKLKALAKKGNLEKGKKGNDKLVKKVKA